MLCVSVFTMFTLNASPLKCNFTSADISTTQDEHVMLAGFAARTELSDGVHLKLRTHCLTISDGYKESFSFRNDIFSGYTNGQNSYLPSEHAYRFRKGYEYEIEQMPSVYRDGIINTVNKVKFIHLRKLR